MPRALYIPIVWFSVALITLVSLGTTAYGHARHEVGPYTALWRALWSSQRMKG